jgi:hypothetical protein
MMRATSAGGCSSVSSISTSVENVMASDAAASNAASMVSAVAVRCDDRAACEFVMR